MKRVVVYLGVLALLLTVAPAVMAQEGETFETQEEVYNVTMVRVHPNMSDVYLNNLKRTWVTGVKAAMEEGLTTDYAIYQTVNGGDQGYNLILVTKHPNLATFDANDAARERADRITKRVREMISEQDADEIVENVYPDIRDILSDRMVREIKFIEEEME